MLYGVLTTCQITPYFFCCSCPPVAFPRFFIASYFLSSSSFFLSSSSTKLCIMRNFCKLAPMPFFPVWASLTTLGTVMVFAIYFLVSALNLSSASSLAFAANSASCYSLLFCCYNCTALVLETLGGGTFCVALALAACANFYDNLSN